MAAVLEAPAAAPEQFPHKLWTRKEYRKLIADGYLEDGKVELANGEIWQNMGQGRRHAATVTWVFAALGKIFGPSRIQGQSFLPVSEYGDSDDEMPLVVEVSDSTLWPDLSGKVRQYGSAGIPECWVADTPNRLRHVFREPAADGYAGETILTTGGEVWPLATPNSVVRAAELLPEL